ncbi:MAG TPA: hypothetical protein VHN14_05555 [Kofleriaceae bacterium]|nr:hypothetical protein [Kofleriaceae bacterium]
MRAILDERRHPEHGYRSCRGLKSLTGRYTPERIEAACERAFIAGARSYRNVESILKNGLDRQPLPITTSSGEAPPPLDHENVRGPVGASCAEAGAGAITCMAWVNSLGL